MEMKKKEKRGECCVLSTSTCGRLVQKRKYESFFLLGLNLVINKCYVLPLGPSLVSAS
jgi:hypothetical protein